MLSRLRFAKRLIRDLPNYGKLAYCLLRDDRVPARNKAIFGAALAIGLNPFINLPEAIPLVGELDSLAITLLALRIFIASCPPELVDEHRQLLVEERSSFDNDLRTGEGAAVSLMRRLRRTPEPHQVDVIELPRNTPPATPPSPSGKQDVSA